MTDHSDAPAVPSPEELNTASTDEAGTPKPRRRRAPAKKAEAQPEVGSPEGLESGSSEAAAEVPAEAAPAKPKRRRAAPKVAEDSTPDAPAAEVPAVTPEPLAPAVRAVEPAASPETRPVVEAPSSEADAEADRAPDTEAAPELSPQETQALVAERFADVLGGAFDAAAEPAAEEAESDKRVLRPQADAPKLQKVLAQSGVSSRRDVEQMVQDGRVVVNGEVAHVGQRVTFGDRIEVDGKPVKVRIAPPPARVLAYHKPVGEVVTLNDPEGRPTVFRSLPRLPHGKWQSVGRLDINTEGLLLFSTSGELANQLMHPRFGVEREYAVRVLGMLDADQRARLLEGVNIDGYDSCFRSIEEGGGEGANHWYRVVIAEGRYREVRRLFEAVGLTVSRLIRIRYGCVVLPRGLRRGQWVELSESDVRAIRRLAQGDRQPSGQPSQGQSGPRQGRPQQNKQGGPKGGGRPEGKFRQEPRPPRQPQAPQQPSGHDDDDFDRFPGDPTHIPNPLEQTFDRRFAKGSKRIEAGFGRPSDTPPRGQGDSRKGGGPKQPDPMQTSIGYIGADAFFRKSSGGGKRRGGGGGGGGGRGFGR